MFLEANLHYESLCLFVPHSLSHHLIRSLSHENNFFLPIFQHLLCFLSSTYCSSAILQTVPPFFCLSVFLSLYRFVWLSVCLYPDMSSASLLWKICPCFFYFQKISNIIIILLIVSQILPGCLQVALIEWINILQITFQFYLLQKKW